MIRITRLTDYGLVVMTQFLRCPERPVRTGRDLAAETRLPLPTVSKILKSLAQAKLLVSHRGVQGGYSLARQPEEISVADVVRAMEGPIAVTLCSHEASGQCELELSCQLRSNWRTINQGIYQMLDSISLVEMSRPLPEPCVTAVSLGKAPRTPGRGAGAPEPPEKNGGFTLPAEADSS